jgi:hypothetical protein
MYEAEVTLPGRVMGTSWVYILAADECANVVEVGATVDLPHRVSRIRKRPGFPKHLVCAYAVPWHGHNESGVHKIENRVHSALYDRRIGPAQDWFLVSTEIAERHIIFIKFAFIMGDSLC